MMDLDQYKHIEVRADAAYERFLSAVEKAREVELPLVVEDANQVQLLRDVQSALINTARGYVQSRLVRDGDGRETGVMDWINLEAIVGLNGSIGLMSWLTEQEEVPETPEQFRQFLTNQGMSC